MYLTSEKEQRRFLREAQLLEELKHPHCLPVYDVGIFSVHEAGVSHDIPYLISKYAVKGSLRDRLNKAHGPLSLPDALAILSQVAQALHYAHQQRVVHRDLKPENILFDEHDNAMLADFGLAIVLQMAKTQPASIAGTPGYMAPEQYNGKVSRRSDQYALGCIAYEMLTGHLPYTSSAEQSSQSSSQETEILLSPSIYNPRIPPDLERVLLKTLQKQREQRYTDVAAFLQAFRASFASHHLSINTFSQASNQAESRSQQTQLYWIEEGQKLFRRQRFEEALKVYQKAIHSSETARFL